MAGRTTSGQTNRRADSCRVAFFLMERTRSWLRKLAVHASVDTLTSALYRVPGSSTDKIAQATVVASARAGLMIKSLTCT